MRHLFDCTRVLCFCNLFAFLGVQLIHAGPAPGSLQFVAASPAVVEGDIPGTVTVTFMVERIGGNDGTLSIDFQTADGSALAGSDFQATSGSLTFPDGVVGPLPIRVTIISDTLTETPEVEDFMIQIGDGAGVFMVEGSLTVEITDDDSPPASVGDRVWLDSNRDGMQDPGEPGLDGVVLTLSSGGSNLATTTTAAGGAYLFENLPADITYTITVDPLTLPASVAAQSGDPDATLDNMSTVTLAPGENNRSQDFGYVPPMFCYAVADEILGDGFRDTLVRINRADGTSQVVGETGTASMEAAAFVPVDVGGTTQLVLFAFANPANPNTTSANTLGRIDLTTGVWTALPNSIGSGTDADGTPFDFTMFGDIDGLAYDVQRNVLWATQRNVGDGTPDFLLQIDPSTGRLVEDAFGTDIDWVAVPLATDPAFQTAFFMLPYDDIDDIAVNPLNGRIYIINNKGGTGGGLVELSPDGMVLEYIGLFTGTTSADGIVDDMEGLSFSSDGRLHGSTGNNGPDEVDLKRLFVIDPATAAATLVGRFPDDVFDFEAVACLTELPPPPANADLQLEKELVSPSPLVAGATAVYSLLVSNAGPTTATNAVLTDLGGLGLTPLGPTVFDLGDLAPGASTSVTVTVSVTNDSREVLCRITNTATVASDTPDSDPRSNRAITTNRVEALVDLFVTKDGPAVFMAPGTLSYTVTTGNNGPSVLSASSFLAEDELPTIPGVFPVVDSVLDTSGADTLFWFLETRAPGASTNLTIAYEISDCCAAMTVTNRVTVRFGQRVCDDMDPNESNNMAVVVTEIVPNQVPPVFIDPPGNLLFDCLGVNSGAAPAAPAVAMDDCSSALVYTFTTNIVSTSCYGGVSRDYVTTATDGCGNTAVHTQQLRYTEDTTPPQITSCPPDMMVGAFDPVPPPMPRSRS